jgi:hypothetical protein
MEVSWIIFTPMADFIFALNVKVVTLLRLNISKKYMKNKAFGFTTGINLISAL